MRNLLLLFLFSLFLNPGAAEAHGRLVMPIFSKPELVTRLPAELPQKISGIAYDGARIWVVIYQGRGLIATLDPTTLGWEVSNAAKARKAISDVAGSFKSPGGICFAGDKLWVAGSYGDSFGSINTSTWEIDRLFKVRQTPDKTASQSYAGMAYDGANLWIAWHWFKYDLAEEDTQQLLKIDTQTGRVIAKYPAPAGAASDGVHGLTWDGKRLWHIKDSTLTSIDPANGNVTGEYILDEIKRPSGLAWDGKALWIAEFGGKIWRLSR